VSASPTIKINRAPVLTLWAAVVAKRLGYRGEEAMSLGKAVAGLNAQSKGRRLCIFKSSPKPAEARKKKHGEEFRIELLGRQVPATRTKDGVRAVNMGKPVEPDGVQRYLDSKFGDNLDAARKAMETLAKSLDRAHIAEQAFDLYAEFRPSIPPGKAGWGAKGVLDVGIIRRLAQ
jgi:hypothetical protein